jgi:hypothetical protein
MKKVLLHVLPKRAPGITQSDMMERVGAKAPKDLFPQRTYMWWAKCVQLDMEAKQEITRDRNAKPLRWWLTK